MDCGVDNGGLHITYGVEWRSWQWTVEVGVDLRRRSNTSRWVSSLRICDGVEDRRMWCHGVGGLAWRGARVAFEKSGLGEKVDLKNGENREEPEKKAQRESWRRGKTWKTENAPKGSSGRGVQKIEKSVTTNANWLAVSEAGRNRWWIGGIYLKPTNVDSAAIVDSTEPIKPFFFYIRSQNYGVSHKFKWNNVICYV